LCGGIMAMTPDEAKSCGYLGLDIIDSPKDDGYYCKVFDLVTKKEIFRTNIHYWRVDAEIEVKLKFPKNKFAKIKI
jgi:hypothetical protein